VSKNSNINERIFSSRTPKQKSSKTTQCDQTKASSTTQEPITFNAHTSTTNTTTYILQRSPNVQIKDGHSIASNRGALHHLLSHPLHFLCTSILGTQVRGDIGLAFFHFNCGACSCCLFCNGRGAGKHVSANKVRRALLGQRRHGIARHGGHDFRNSNNGE